MICMLTNLSLSKHRMQCKLVYLKTDKKLMGTTHLFCKLSINWSNFAILKK